MFATLISIVIALLLKMYHIDIPRDSTFFGWLMLAVSIPTVLIFPFGMMMAWLPLQKAEMNSSPRVMGMFHYDWHVRIAGIWLVIFPLVTFALVMDLIYIHSVDSQLVVVIWTVLLGITLDMIRHFIERVMAYLNPFSVVKLFTLQAKKSIQNDKELDLCHWIDGLSEVSIKGIQRHSTSVANIALSEEQEVARLFLETSKTIGHSDRDKQSAAMGITDKVSYTMFYLYQRFDMAFDKAVRNRLETTCSHIVTLLGKIAVSAAKYDVSMASAPLRFIGKCGKRAQDEGLEESALTASCTLFEVGKSILSEIDISYYEIKDAFLSIINGMEVLAKGAFKRDKTMNLQLLIQPFKDFKALFQNGKAKDHQDTSVIMRNIERVIGEFEALQLVMSTLPAIPSVPEEDTIR